MAESADDSSPRTAREGVWRRLLALSCLSLLLSISISITASNQGPVGPSPEREPPGGQLVTFTPEDAAGLSRVLGLAWAGLQSGEVPNLAPSVLPPDLGKLPPAQRKDLFARSVLPHVLQANLTIARDRRGLLRMAERLAEGEPLGEVEMVWLVGVASRYQRDPEVSERVRREPLGIVHALLTRVDVIPPSLALAQAAKESGWGTSRFSLEGNALFGQWVFSAGAGMAPREIPAGASHAVARFETIGNSVASYMRNLNTLWAYRPLRERRASMRRGGDPLDPLDLAEGLLLYSERRAEYVAEVRELIRGNRMAEYDGARLRRLDRQRLSKALALGESVAAAAAGSRGSPDV